MMDLARPHRAGRRRAGRARSVLVESARLQGRPAELVAGCGRGPGFCETAAQGLGEAPCAAGRLPMHDGRNAHGFVVRGQGRLPGDGVVPDRHAVLEPAAAALRGQAGVPGAVIATLPRAPTTTTPALRRGRRLRATSRTRVVPSLNRLVRPRARRRAVCLPKGATRAFFLWRRRRLTAYPPNCSRDWLLLEEVKGRAQRCRCGSRPGATGISSGCVEVRTTGGRPPPGGARRPWSISAFKAAVGGTAAEPVPQPVKAGDARAALPLVEVVWRKRTRCLDLCVPSRRHGAARRS